MYDLECCSVPVTRGSNNMRMAIHVHGVYISIAQHVQELSQEIVSLFKVRTYGVQNETLRASDFVCSSLKVCTEYLALLIVYAHHEG